MIKQHQILVVRIYQHIRFHSYLASLYIKTQKYLIVRHAILKYVYHLQTYSKIHRAIYNIANYNIHNI